MGLFTIAPGLWSYLNTTRLRSQYLDSVHHCSQDVHPLFSWQLQHVYLYNTMDVNFIVFLYGCMCMFLLCSLSLYHSPLGVIRWWLIDWLIDYMRVGGKDVREVRGRWELSEKARLRPKLKGCEPFARVGAQWQCLPSRPVSLSAKPWVCWSQHLDDGGVSSRDQHTTTNTERRRCELPRLVQVATTDPRGVDSWKIQNTSDKGQRDLQLMFNLCVLFVWREESGEWSSCLVGSRMVTVS